VKKINKISIHLSKLLLSFNKKISDIFVPCREIIVRNSQSQTLHCRWSAFHLRPGHVGFVVDVEALGNAFS
jgi:hypothetical protein